MKSKNISVSLIRLYGGVLLLLLVITFTGCIFFAGSDTGIAVPNLTIKGAPSDITALSLRITGPGMSPVESYYSSVPSSIEIEVPAGVDRQFELIAYIGASSPSAATSFKGTATVDLAAGETQNITLNMITNSTKLVIPDYWANRIVQIDNIKGGGWIDISGTDIGYGANNQFDPYDIDFDAQGRIYIANNDNIAGGVIRIDNMNDTIYDPIISLGSILAITIDRKNNYLYYATGSQLYRCDLEGNNNGSLAMDAISIIRGMTVDENGILYIAGANALGQDRVFRYDPVSQVVTATNSNANLNEPWDVLVKQDYLYVANFNPFGSLKILSTDHNLSSDEWFGDSPPPENPGYFYGPRRFIAALNRRIYILDEGFSGNRESILAMDNIGPWDNWNVFRAEDIGETKFALYSTC